MIENGYRDFDQLKSKYDEYETMNYCIVLSSTIRAFLNRARRCIVHVVPRSSNGFGS